jgi:hypothetical protein
MWCQHQSLHWVTSKVYLRDIHCECPYKLYEEPHWITYLLPLLPLHGLDVGGGAELLRQLFVVEVDGPGTLLQYDIAFTTSNVQYRHTNTVVLYIWVSKITVAAGVKILSGCLLGNKGELCSSAAQQYACINDT